MFVTVLLAAGLLALEREEQAFGRLVRGLVSRDGAARREDRAERAVRVRRDAADAGRPGGVRGARLGPDPGLARRAGRRRARLRRAWAWRSAASRARCAPRRCWPSCWRCRSSSSRSCRPAASTPGSTTRSTSISGLFPFKPALRALDAAINGGELLLPVVHLLALATGYFVAARIALRRVRLT